MCSFALATRTIGWLALLGLTLLPLGAGAAVPIEQFDVQQPRAFGYKIGDKFERSIALRLRHPYQLEPLSLPLAGRLNDWLSLEVPTLAQHSRAGYTQYDIRLTYQVVNIDPTVGDIPVPQHELRYGDGRESFNTLVAATRIRLAVVSDWSRNDLRPAQTPVLLNHAFARSAVFAGLLLTALSGMVILNSGLPWFKGRGPFVQISRQLKQFRRREWNDDSYTAALKSIHQAFNQTAGKIVFAETLDDFFDKHSTYNQLQQPIRDYYARSQQYFFSASEDASAPRYSLAELIALAHACRTIERAVT